MKGQLITLLGRELVVGINKDGEYLIGVPSVESSLSMRPNSTREIIASKSFKAIPGIGLALGKNSECKTKLDWNGTRYSAATVELFIELIKFKALNGNESERQAAMNILMTLAEESIYNRIDGALGKQLSADEIEQRSFASYREKCKKQFRPEFTDSVAAWLQSTGLSTQEANWAVITNNLKSALGLPLISIDDYTEDQINRWSSGMANYSLLANSGMPHPDILQFLEQNF
jgi:hypothetical protein